MSIGFALVIIFVLHLIDKHGLWRKVAKLTLWSVAICAVVAGGIYGWNGWTANKTAVRKIDTGWTNSRIEIPAAAPAKHGTALLSDIVSDAGPAPSKPDPLDKLGVPAFPRSDSPR